MSVQIESSIENNKKLCEWRSKDIDGDARIICIILIKGELFIPLVYKGDNRETLFLLGGKRKEFFNTRSDERRKESSEETAIREAIEEGGVCLDKEYLYLANRRRLSLSKKLKTYPYQDFFVTIIYDNFDKVFIKPKEGIDKVLLLKLNDVIKKRTTLHETHLRRLISSLRHVMEEVVEIGINSKSSLIADLSSRMMQERGLSYLFTDLERRLKVSF